MALTDQLVSYWKFNESSGNAADSVGSNTLTNNNSTAFALGKMRNGADFEASSSNYFTKSSPTGLTGLSAFTLSFWFKPESIGTDQNQTFFAIYVNTGNQRALQIFRDDVSGTNRLGIVVSGDGTNTADNYINQTLNNGTWYHIVYTFNAGVYETFVNGSSIGGATLGQTSIFGSTAPLQVGDRNFAGTERDFVDGIMDEMGFWSRALSGAEITELYNNGNGFTYPFKIAYDASSEGSVSGGTATATIAHTCSTNNPILYIGITNQNSGGFSAVTYGGVAATLVDQNNTGSDYQYLYRVVAPATGANNVVVTRNTTTGSMFVKNTSYKGVDQSSPVSDTDKGSSVGTVTTLTITTTPVDDNCWSIFYATNWDGGSVTIGTNLWAERGTSNLWNRPLDTNSENPAGAISLTATKPSGGSGFQGVVESFRPVQAPSGPANLKTYNTNPKANIKTMNTNPIANVKTFDTNA